MLKVFYLFTKINSCNFTITHKPPAGGGGGLGGGVVPAGAVTVKMSCSGFEPASLTWKPVVF